MRLNSQVIRIEPQAKRFKIPDGFYLLQDTREQRPLFDESVHIEGLEVINTCLIHGDYSIKGFEDRFAIERKRLSDFFSYIGKGREHTVHKMRRFDEMIHAGGFVGLVIEASESDLLTGYMMSRVSPETARQAIVSFEMRYGVHVYYNRSRDDLIRWVLDRAIKFYRIKRETKS